MRRTAVTSFVAAAAFAGAFAFAAAGGDTAPGADARDASRRTSHAPSVHYAVDVTLTKAKHPMTLRIRGGSSRGRLVASLALGEMRGAILVDEPFLYEKAPGGLQILGNVDWLRLRMSGRSQRSRTLSTIHSLTPAPLFRVIAEARLQPTATPGVFAGPVAYDDPVVRTALRDLANGLEFRGLRLHVAVGRDGLVHAVHLTGRTADARTTLDLRARLFGFGKPVSVTPPQPGTFVDPELERLQA